MKKLTILLGCTLFFLISNAQNHSAEENKKIIKLERLYLTNKKAYQTEKQNQTSKKNYIETTLKLAHLFLISKHLPPKIKYPRALKLYREVLSIEPKHPLALESKNLIESIYKSMNRPIPK